MSVVISGGQLRQITSASPGAFLGRPGTSFVEMDVPHFAALRQDARELGILISPELVYRTQGNVREVVDYLVTRFSRVPLYAYDKVSDTQRVRLPDTDPLAVALKEPWPGVPQSRFLPELLRDRLLWDRWASVVITDSDGQPRLKRLPPRLWIPLVGGDDEVVGIRVGGKVDLRSDQVVMWTGRAGGQTPMRALQAALRELITAAKYREQVFARTGRFPAYATRPVDATKLSTNALQRLQADFNAQWAGDDAPDAGGIPVLEEGMELKDIRAFTPSDVQYLEGVQLGAVQVCNYYHLAPELIGVRAGNFSNQDAHRQGLYVETLGAYYTSFAEEFNVQLVPAIASRPTAYVDYLMEAALSGSFLEQAEAYSRATGSPWLLRSEARAKQNLPPVKGMDEAIVPLNVVVGGLTSPAGTAPDEAPQKGVVLLPASMVAQLTAGHKDPRPRLAERVGDRLADDLSEFFAMQGRSILTQLGASKSGPALQWDHDRWNAELSAVLLRSTPLIAGAAARHVLERIDPSYDWSDDPMLNYLRAGADRTAQAVNKQTHDDVAAALAQDDWQDRVGAVFGAAAAGRATALARSMTTHVTSFGEVEAAKATGAGVKTWRVTSNNPRASHAAIDNLSVGLHSVFPNGLRWPGDPSGSADEVAGCTCTLDIGVGGV